MNSIAQLLGLERLPCEICGVKHKPTKPPMRGVCPKCQEQCKRVLRQMYRAAQGDVETNVDVSSYPQEVLAALARHDMIGPVSHIENIKCPTCGLTTARAEDGSVPAHKKLDGSICHGKV